MNEQFVTAECCGDEIILNVSFGTQGDKGEQGEQGIQGIQGEKGDKGGAFELVDTKLRVANQDPNVFTEQGNYSFNATVFNPEQFGGTPIEDVPEEAKYGAKGEMSFSWNGRADGRGSVAMLGGAAYGDLSLSIGGQTNGEMSVALVGSTAHGKRSMAVMGSTAREDYQFALGGYTDNSEDAEDTALIVGAGEDVGKNRFMIYKDGGLGLLDTQTDAYKRVEVKDSKMLIDGAEIKVPANGIVEAGNTNAVSGGKVFISTISNTTEIKNKDNTLLGYYDLAGTKPSALLASTTNIAGIFDVTNFEKVVLTKVNGGNASRAWAFVDINDNILTKAEQGVTIVTETEISKPLGAVKLYTNSSFGTNPVYRDEFRVDLTTLVKSKFDKLITDVAKNGVVLDSMTKDVKDVSVFQSGYYDLTGAQPSSLTASAVTRSAIFDISKVKKVTLKMIYGGASSRAYAFVDINNNILVRAETNARFPSRTIETPTGAVKLYVNSSSSSLDYPFSAIRIELFYAEYDVVQQIENLKNKQVTSVSVNAFLPKRTDGYSGVKNTFSLAGVDIAVNNKKYYTKGYLFTEYPASNGKVYYANSLQDTPTLICDFVNRQGLTSQYTVSPKHRSVITATYDATAGYDFKVFENGTYSNIMFSNPAYGWLYNFGQYFGEDTNGNEYFLCGEYSHAETPTRRIFKATYPYSNQANWKVVHEFISPEIHHIHQIVKDNYTNVLYCFTGDSAKESNIYYSNNEGETWNLLARSQDIGSGTNAVLRATQIHIFEDKIIYASDDDYHVLVEIKKNVDGLLDISTLKILATLKSGQMTNGSYYDYNTNRLFMMDRVRVATSTLEMYCYDFNEMKLIKVGGYKQTSTTTNELWGNRGRAYVVYPNNTDRVFGVGISSRIHLQFDFPENDNLTYGGLYYKF